MIKKGGAVTEGFTIKPNEFRDSVVRADEIGDIWSTVKPLTKRKKRVPVAERRCGSCLYCQESGSVYYCLNQGSVRYKDLVDEFEGCPRFAASYY